MSDRSPARALSRSGHFARLRWRRRRGQQLFRSHRRNQWRDGRFDDGDERIDYFLDRVYDVFDGLHYRIDDRVHNRLYDWLDNGFNHWVDGFDYRIDGKHHRQHDGFYDGRRVQLYVRLRFGFGRIGSGL